MTERLQSGIHPDADQISVFLEGSATEHERVQMLEHMAQCSVCRETVFVAHGAETALRPAAALEGPRPVKRLTRWWMPYGLAGAALAAVVTLVLFLHRPGAPVTERQMATVQSPAKPPESGPQTQATEQEERPREAGRSAGNVGGDRVGVAARNAPRAVGNGSGGGVGAGLGAAPAASPAVAMNDQAIEAARGNMAQFSHNAAGAAATAQASASQAVATRANPAPQTPPALPTAQGGPAATQSYSQSKIQSTGQNLATLQILHDEGFVEGTAEVSGVVTDVIGAVIPQASVSLHGASGQTIREVTTGPNGGFRIAEVPAGRYEMRISARGFMVTSEQIELKSRDVAKVDSVLPIGAETQTVSVEANNAPVGTSPTDAATTALLQNEKLPGGAAGVAREELGDRVLTIDAAGNLYLSRNAGKSWKRIKPKWTGKAARLAELVYIETGSSIEAIGVKKPEAARASSFMLTTDTGAVWISEDGKHGRPQADGNR